MEECFIARLCISNGTGLLKAAKVDERISEEVVPPVR